MRSRQNEHFRSRLNDECMFRCRKLISDVIDVRSKMSSPKYLVIDTETTGLDPSIHRVVEVAAVLVADGKIVSAFTTYVNPQRSIPAVVTAIHGLVDSDVVDAPTLEETLPRLNALVAEADVLVAHNAPFDRSMLPGLVEKPWLDTLQLARRLYPNLESHKNSVLRYELGLRCPEADGMPAHRALSDAYVTARLLIHLLTATHAQEEYPVDPVQLIEFLNAPVLLPVCNFGKHRGQPWNEIPRGYLEWVVKSDMPGDVVYTARYWLKQR